jgi:hypothetical protein
VVASLVCHDDSGFLDKEMLDETRLNLSEFYSESTDLDLIVVATQENDIAA